MMPIKCPLLDFTKVRVAAQSPGTAPTRLTAQTQQWWVILDRDGSVHGGGSKQCTFQQERRPVEDSPAHPSCNVTVDTLFGDSF
jgi:hypothetical protein